MILTKRTVVGGPTRATRSVWGIFILLFAITLVMAGCGGSAEKPADSSASGNLQRGKELFSSAGCSGCHSTGTDQIVGPGLAGLSDREKLPNGKVVNDENLKEWIKTGGSGSIGVMPGNPQLSSQDLDDLVTYLKSLK